MGCPAEGRNVDCCLGILLKCWPVKELRGARLAFVSQSGLVCPVTVGKMRDKSAPLPSCSEPFLETQEQCVCALWPCPLLESAAVVYSILGP